MNNSKISPLKIFIAASITNKLGKPKEINKLRCLVETIDHTAQRYGAKTNCALREENWKAEESPSVYVPRDMNWCIECNGAIALPERSYGVRIEEGWITMLKKPLLRLHKEKILHMGDLEEHLNFISPVFDRVFQDLFDVVSSVAEFIHFLKGEA